MAVSTAEIVVAGIAALFVLIVFARSAQPPGPSTTGSPPQCQAQVHIDEDIQPEIEQSIRRGTFLHDTCQRFRRYGRTFTARVRGRIEIQTIEPRNIQAYLATQFEDFGLEPLRRNMQREFWGLGIHNSDSIHWRRSRTMLRPIFKRTEWGNTELLRPHIQRLMSTIISKNKQESFIDLEPVLRNYMLDTSTEFLFGDAVGAQDAVPPEEGQAFMRSYDSISNATGERRETGFRKPWWTWFGIRYSPAEYEKTPTMIIHQFIEKRVRLALAAKSTTFNADKTISSADTRVVALNEMVKTTDDIVTVRSQLLHMFMPASETTAVLLGSTLYAIARTPHVWKRFREDVRHISKNYSFEEVKNLAYLRWILQESLRLYPPIIGNKRVALRDTTLPVGGGPHGDSRLTVSKGTIVHASAFALQRDPDLWGPDADLFKPERWESERQDWRFLPFSGGPRICIAQQCVLTEASYVLIELARRFIQIEPRDDKPWTEGLRFTMRSKWGVKVHLIPDERYE